MSITAEIHIKIHAPLGYPFKLNKQVTYGISWILKGVFLGSVCGCSLIPKINGSAERNERMVPLGFLIFARLLKKGAPGKPVSSACLIIVAFDSYYAWNVFRELMS